MSAHSDDQEKRNVLVMPRLQQKPWVEQAKLEADEHIAKLQKLIGLLFYAHSLSWDALQSHGATEWEDEDGVSIAALRKRILGEMAK